MFEQGNLLRRTITASSAHRIQCALSCGTKSSRDRKQHHPSRNGSWPNDRRYSTQGTVGWNAELLSPRCCVDSYNMNLKWAWGRGMSRECQHGHHGRANRPSRPMSIEISHDHRSHALLGPGLAPRLSFFTLRARIRSANSRQP